MATPASESLAFVCSEGELLSNVEGKYLAPGQKTTTLARAWQKDPDKLRMHQRAREHPRWIPDTKAPRCNIHSLSTASVRCVAGPDDYPLLCSARAGMLCATEFVAAGLGARVAGLIGMNQDDETETSSRHHCRYCGWVVCDGCSPGQRTDPTTGETLPVRFHTIALVSGTCL